MFLLVPDINMEILYGLRAIHVVGKLKTIKPRDVLHLTRTGKNVFGHRMKNFIRRALNRIGMGGRKKHGGKDG